MWVVEFKEVDRCFWLTEVEGGLAHTLLIHNAKHFKTEDEAKKARLKYFSRNKDKYRGLDVEKIALVSNLKAKDLKINSRNKKYYCISCGEELPQLYADIEVEEDWENMFEGGIVDMVVGGYGSSFDGAKLIIAVCDNCIKEKKLEAV